MNFYVYKITNLINNKIYIGFSHIDGDPTAHKYFGSGKLIIKAIEKYSIENFKKDILFIFDTLEQALHKEAEIVDFDFVTRLDTYNIRLGGKGGFLTCHNKNKTTIKNKITNRNKYVFKEEVEKYLLTKKWELGSNGKNRTPLWNNKTKAFIYIDKQEKEKYLQTGNFEVRNTTSNKICVTNLKTSKLKYINKNEIEKLSDDYIRGNKKSGVNKNRIWVYDLATLKNKIVLKDELSKYLDHGYNQGRIMIKNQKIFIYNIIENKEKMILKNELENYEKLGWLKGRQKLHPNIINTIFIYNEEFKTCKRIKKDQLTKFLNNGWRRGINKRKTSCPECEKENLDGAAFNVHMKKYHQWDKQKSTEYKKMIRNNN